MSDPTGTEGTAGLLTLDDCAEILGWPVPMARKLLLRGDLSLRPCAHVRVTPRIVRIHAADLAKWIEDRRTELRRAADALAARGRAGRLT